MSKTQRELITLAAAPLRRFYGVVAVSQNYQNFKISETATFIRQLTSDDKSNIPLRISIQMTGEVKRSNRI